MLTIHKASAGSGKTYALTRRYLKLLLGYKDTGGNYRLRPAASYGLYKPKAHGEILAVTFTNKATQEMTARIVKELALLAEADSSVEGHEKSSYLSDFVEEFKTDKSTLADHARMALHDLLFNFSWFNVSTIDAFFQRVLNTFTRELELSPTRGVEIDETFAISSAVGKMMQSINLGVHDAENTELSAKQRHHLEHWLLEFMRSKMQSGQSANVFSRSSGFHAGLLKEISSFYNEQYKINREKIDSYFSDPERIVRFSREIAERGYPMRRAKVLSEQAVAVRHLCGDKGNANFRKLLDKLAAGDLDLKEGKTGPKVAADPSAAFNKKDDPSEMLLMEVSDLMNDVVVFNNRVEFLKLLSKNIYQLGLFGHVNRYLEEFRRENDSLLLSDTGDLLKKIIGEQEAPFIYERMGAAIHHYLIDEFQDTSLMQWENLRPLVLESMSGGHDNLIIGDEKQCIYRFRNSDPALLGSEVQNVVETRFPGNVDIRGMKVEENTNWRSSVEVVEFNNTIFNSLASILDNTADRVIERTYAGLVQQVSKKHAEMPGYVCVRFLPSAPNIAESEDQKCDDESNNREDLKQRQLDVLTAEISRQLSAGYRPSDIAVLVRKGWQSKEIIAHLMRTMEDPASGWKHGQVPLVSSDSIPVGMSHAVRLIVNVLRLTAEPMKVLINSNSSRAKLAINPEYQRARLVHRFELERFTTIADDRETSDVRRLSDSEALERAVVATVADPGAADYDETQREIDAMVTKLCSMESPTLMNLVESIIKHFLPDDARRTDIAFITAFQDIVLEFSENGNNSADDFLKYWELRGQYVNVEAPEDMQGINVTTIHKAKGLEYKCVHVPYFSGNVVGEDSMMRRSMGWYELGASVVPYIDNPDDVPPFMLLPNNLRNKKFPEIARQVERWEVEQIIDSLNVAYVAFTRAVSELCVYVDRMPATFPEPGMRAETANRRNATPGWGDFLYRAIEATTLESIQNIENDKRKWMVPLSGGLNRLKNGEMTFTLGEPVIPIASVEPDMNSADVPDENLEDELNGSNTSEIGASFAGNYKFTEDYKVNDSAQIFAEMDLEDISGFDFENERHRGMFLHSVLSRVRRMSDLPLALRGRASRYHLTLVQTEQCRNLLEQAMTDERCTPWFDGFERVLMERSIASRMSVRRPDRVVWLPDGRIVVVDYKFGKIRKQQYHEQVRDYCSLLEASGYKNIEGYLWYPLEREVIRVV